MRKLKLAVVILAQRTGLNALLMRSRWRGQRLLILCYHGVSIEQEHEWNPSLYISPEALGRRFELLRRYKCSVLPLEEALWRTAEGRLPPRSVALTFDDGLSDFHEKAMPLLNSFDLPATVYLTSFHCLSGYPVFYLACSYLLWKHRDRTMAPLPFAGLLQPVPLSNRSLRSRVLPAIESWLRMTHPSAPAQQDAFEQLAQSLCTTAAELGEKRILHLMTPAQVSDAARQGFSVQLHTHRHRTPTEADLFAREINENRVCIEQWTGRTPHHFCYPSGIVHPQFGPWLREQGICSAVTCEAGLATASDDPLLLPRLIDSSALSESEFVSWLSGSGALLRTLKPHRAFAMFHRP